MAHTRFFFAILKANALTKTDFDSDAMCNHSDRHGAKRMGFCFRPRVPLKLPQAANWVLKPPAAPLPRPPQAERGVRWLRMALRQLVVALTRQGDTRPCS